MEFAPAIGICIRMQALCYRIFPLGWVTCRWLRYVWPGCLLTGLNGLSLCEVDPPELPSERWVRVRTLLAGICGSDAAVIAQKQPPDSILQSFASIPCVLGHENVAVVEEVGAKVSRDWLGRRVCVEPTLCCKVRGIEPPCPRCAEGQYGACENFAANGLGEGKLPPGTAIGYNGAVGGSFSECFVAHEKQLVPLPDEISDEQAVLTDPIACGLHAVLRSDRLGQAQQVLVYGAGVIGLGVITALRAVGYQGRIDAIGRRPMAERLARQMGANGFLNLSAARADRFGQIAVRTGAALHRARFGNYMLSGGYDVIFDCVATRQSMNESLKWVRARGQVVLVGTGHGGRIDLTPVWFREVELIGSYGRQVERYQGAKIETYPLVHALMTSGKVDTRNLLTHMFRLGDYRKAMRVALNKGKHDAIKVVFDFREPPQVDRRELSDGCTKADYRRSDGQ